jgi:hypothetical protein
VSNNEKGKRRSSAVVLCGLRVSRVLHQLQEKAFRTRVGEGGFGKKKGGAWHTHGLIPTPAVLSQEKDTSI